MTGFEGHGDFYSDNPYERYVAHQASKGNWPPPFETVTTVERIVEWKTGDRCRLVDLRNGRVLDGNIESIATDRKGAIFLADNSLRYSVPLDASRQSSFLKEIPKDDA